jgi:glucosamine kinase
VSDRAIREAGGVVIGIDGGGTRTRATVADVDGYVRGEASAGGSHPGKNPDAAENIAAAVGDALKQADRATADVCCLVAGIAGYNSPEDEAWAVALTDLSGIACPRIHMNDAVVAQVGAFNGESGIVAIAGTGSIVLGRTEAGRTIRNYDFSHMPGAHARGLSRDVVWRIVTADAVSSDAGFVSEVLDVWGVQNIADLRDAIVASHQGSPVEDMRRFAAMAPLATRAAVEGVPLAQAACDALVNELCRGVRLVATCFDENTAAPVGVALIGGVVRSAYIATAVRARLESGTGRARSLDIVEPVLTPERGAALIALRELGVACDTIAS